MAVAATINGGCFPSKFPPLSITNQIKPQPLPVPRLPPPPLHISTNPTHVNAHHLKDLCALCNHSCHRFPAVDSTGKVEPVDLDKLCTALSHSSVVVSVFTREEYVTTQPDLAADPVKVVGGDWIRRLIPVSPENGQLIGFGRAVTDFGLTASIYDIVVHPSLQGRGIGMMIVKRIIRVLTNRDIYDITAVCSTKERFFFKACGFRDDALGSTTMMYTRTASGHCKDEQIVSAGRKLLLVPRPRQFLRS